MTVTVIANDTMNKTSQPRACIMHAVMMSVQLSLVATLKRVSAAVQKRSKLVCSFRALQDFKCAAHQCRYAMCHPAVEAMQHVCKGSQHAHRDIYIHPCTRALRSIAPSAPIASYAAQQQHAGRRSRNSLNDAQLRLRHPLANHTESSKQLIRHELIIGQAPS